MLTSALPLIHSTSSFNPKNTMQKMFTLRTQQHCNAFYKAFHQFTKSFVVQNLADRPNLLANNQLVSGCNGL